MSTTKVCDNASVGVIITNAAGDYLMFDRNTFPPGVAPVAGHIDTHGTARQAAEAEVREEVGLTVVSLMEITAGWRTNRCRRQPGPRGVGHQWTVFHAVVTGALDPSQRETRNVRWISRADVLALCSRTSRYAQGELSDAEFAARPGIEPVWVRWLLSPDSWLRNSELDLIDQLASRGTDTEAGAR